MVKLKKLLTALILSALIISSSGCEFSENSPVIGSEAELSSSEVSSESSSSVQEIIIIPEEPEPEPEPVVEPVFSLSSNSVERGGYFIIKAENVDLSELVFEDFLGYERSFFEKDGAWFCLIPIKPDTDAGYYPLKIASEDFEFRTTVTVLNRKFNTQYLVVAQETLDATLEDAAVREGFAQFFEEMRYYYSEEVLWNGEFMKPLGNSWYNETTSFGTFRTFSSGRTEWHDAIDMAVGGGTPIYATNSGKVIFSGWLGLTGNTIILDHGAGVMSWHYHLYKTKVAEGDFVEKGTTIGLVGTTGLSTGNHLHFGITVGGVFVDPAHFFGTEPNLDFGEVEA